MFNELISTITKSSLDQNITTRSDVSGYKELIKQYSGSRISACSRCSQCQIMKQSKHIAEIALCDFNALRAKHESSQSKKNLINI